MLSYFVIIQNNMLIIFFYLQKKKEDKIILTLWILTYKENNVPKLKKGGSQLLS